MPSISIASCTGVKRHRAATRHSTDDAIGWYRAVHVKNIDMQKMRSLLANRKLLKRKLIDTENHIGGTVRAYGLLIGAVGRGSYEAPARELLEHSDSVFSVMIEIMLESHAILGGLHHHYARA
jgi:transposase